MAQAKNKTTATDAPVKAFIDKQPDEGTRADCNTLVKMMERVTGEKGRMWGPGIVGFGTYHYKYESGREGEFLVLGFSPRKTNLTVYGAIGAEPDEALLKKLGKFTTGKGCLYMKRLVDVDQKVLEQMLAKRLKERAKERIK